MSNSPKYLPEENDDTWGSGTTPGYSYHFRWQIDNFTNIFNELKFEETVKSPVFPLGESGLMYCQAIFYPKGWHDKSADGTTIQMQFTTQHITTSMWVNYRYYIMDKHGKALHRWSYGPSLTNIAPGQPALVTGYSLISQPVFHYERDTYYPDDTLYFKCEGLVKILRFVISSHTMGSPNIPPEQLSQDLQTLMGNNDLTDVTVITSDGTKFEAHAAILYARSPVLAQLLETTPKELHLADCCDGDILPLFMSYLYSGIIPELTINTASRMLSSGIHYKLPMLQTSTETYLAKQLNIDNVLEMYITASKMQTLELQERIQHFFYENKIAIQKQQNWEEFKQNHSNLATVLVEGEQSDNYAQEIAIARDVQVELEEELYRI